MAWVSVASDSAFRLAAPAAAAGCSGATSGATSGSASGSSLSSDRFGAESLADDRFGLPRLPDPGVGLGVGAAGVGVEGWQNKVGFDRSNLPHLTQNDRRTKQCN